MATLIIADDETNVREGLRDVVKWDEYNIEVIGEAANGREALELCRSLKPDILLTDIRMPELDGLQVCERIREEGLATRVIIISGAQDFDYAKKALQYNAEGYILKPIRMEELSEVFREVISSMQLERNQSDLLETMRSQIKESLPIIRGKFLYQVLTGQVIDPLKITEKAKYFNIPIQDDLQYGIAVMRIKQDMEISRWKKYEDRELLQFSILNITEEIIGSSGIAIGLDETDLAVVFCNITFDTIYTKAEKLIDTVYKLLKVQLTIGLGGMQSGYSGISHSFQEAKEALRLSFYTGTSVIVTAQDLPYQPRRFDRDGALKALFNEVIHYAQLGDVEEVERHVQQLFELLASSLLPVIDVQSLVLEYLFAAHRLLKQDEGEVQSFIPGQITEEVFAQKHLVELKNYFRTAFTQWAEYYAQIQVRKNYRLIQKIQQYVQQNYMTELKIEDIAKYVFLSPNYMSQTFRKETGSTLMEYITKVRIEAAIELMKSSDLKIMDIANMVGYENATYFSTVFRKQTGIYPQKYREVIIDSLEK